MVKVVSPANRFSGTVQVPPDKSLTHRAIFFSALAKGDSTIANPLVAEDCLSTADCMAALGVKIDREGPKWKITSGGSASFRAPSAPLNCGNSGTTMRLISGILAAHDFTTTLIGDVSLSKRPMNRVAEPLSKMGARFELTNNKFAPIKITGTKNLKSLHWKNPVASAQVKSAVLLAALHANGETIYEEPTLSRDHTERMLAACGVPVSSVGAVIRVKGPATLKVQDWVIPADISSAAFFLVAALLVPDARVRLTAVNVNPTRTGILDLLTSAGASIRQENAKTVGGEPVADLVIDRQPTLGPLRLDAVMAPRLIDELPIIAIAASQAAGSSMITGVEELRFKETDRLAAIARNLTAMGGKVQEKKDGLIIDGPTPLHGANVDSFDDHRIAMAFAIAGLIAKGKTTIHGSECVAISFPSFWDQLAGLSQ